MSHIYLNLDWKVHDSSVVVLLVIDGRHVYAGYPPSWAALRWWHRQRLQAPHGLLPHAASNYGTGLNNYQICCAYLANTAIQLQYQISDIYLKVISTNTFTPVLSLLKATSSSVGAL